MLVTFLKVHLQLDDSQQVPLRSLKDCAALTEVDGIRLPPAVRVVKDFRRCVLHGHTLLQTGLQRQTQELGMRMDGCWDTLLHRPSST